MRRKFLGSIGRGVRKIRRWIRMMMNIFDYFLVIYISSIKLMGKIKKTQLTL
jgi:hypothetical protein